MTRLFGRTTFLAPLLLLMVMVPLLATGCSKTTRTIAKVTQNKFADASAGTFWVVPPPGELDVPAEKTVYISFTNVSDQTEINCTTDLRAACSATGWTVVSDPTSAPYRIRARLRYFGRVEKETGGQEIAEQMGWIDGAALTEAAGVLLDQQTDDWAEAEVARGGIMANVNLTGASAKEWAAIFDIVLEERLESETAFERYSAASGESSETVATYYPHGVRLSVWAHQLGMTQDEALPLIHAEVQKAIMGLLPGQTDEVADR